MLPVFATAYLPPISYFQSLLIFESAAIEQWEHFQKQTIRNRCFILSPNGIQSLSIPVVHKHSEKQLIKDLQISDASPWQRTHWRSVKTAYQRSPFFEYYEDDFKHYYLDKKYKWLVDFNEQQLHWLLKSLKHPVIINRTTSYDLLPQSDFRHLSNVKDVTNIATQKFKTYNQVFSYKTSFTPNLSIIDLLFNTGNLSMEYLRDSFN